MYVCINIFFLFFPLLICLSGALFSLFTFLIKDAFEKLIFTRFEKEKEHYLFFWRKQRRKFKNNAWRNALFLK